MKPNYLTNQSNQGRSGGGARRGGFWRGSGGGGGGGGRSKGGRGPPPWERRYRSKSAKKTEDSSTQPLQGITLMVALSEYPKQIMTDEQLTSLEDEILESIDRITDTIRPQFYDCKRDTGALLIRCNNALTANWLKEIVPQLNIWEEAKLKVVDAVTTSKQVSKFIVPSGYPLNFFTTDQLNKLYSDILKEIDKIPEGSFMPQFLNCLKERGALKFDCNNLPSGEWLRTTVPHLENWKELEVQVCDPTDIPQRSTLQLWIPGPAEEPEQVLERLERQNKGIKSSEWIVLNRKVDETGQKIFVTVDDGILSELKKIDYNPFLNFTKVRVKRLGKYKPREKKEDEKNDEVKDDNKDGGDGDDDLADVFTAIDEIVGDETVDSQK